MKHTIAIAVSMFTLLTAPVFAGNEDMAAKLAGASSSAKVEVQPLQQKLAHCVNNAKNEGFNCNTYVGCGERKSYVASCMNGNEALVHYASINREVVRTNTNTAVADYNQMLQQAPTAAGDK